MFIKCKYLYECIEYDSYKDGYFIVRILTFVHFKMKGS